MFSVVGTLPLYYFLDAYRYNTGIQDPALVLIVLFFSSVNILVFLFGVVFVRRVIGLRPVELISREMCSLSLLQKVTLFGAFSFCIFVLFSYLTQLDQISILVALTEGADAAKQARSDMGNSFSGKYHWYKLVMHDIGRVLTFSCFALWLNKSNPATLIAFLVTFSYSTFVAVMATEKGPFAWLVIGLFMTYFLVKNNGYIPLKKLIPFIFAVIGLLVIAYLYFMGADSVWAALWSVFSRSFSGSISPAYFYLEFFPVHQDYLWGQTFPNPGGLMPYEPYRYTIEIMNWRFSSLTDSGVVGTAPTVFWGEAYANFGPFGIPIVAFFMGGLVAVGSYFISKLEVNPLSIGFIVWLILSIKGLSTTGFSGYLYNIYIFVSTFFIIFVFFIRGRIRVRK